MEIGIVAGNVKVFFVGTQNANYLIKGGMLYYGNYGGVNYVGGQTYPPGTEVPAEAFLVPSVDALDELFRQHDLGYTLAQNKDDFALADQRLVQGIEALKSTAAWGEMRAEERLYANLAQSWFDPSTLLVRTLDNW